MNEHLLLSKLFTTVLLLTRAQPIMRLHAVAIARSRAHAPCIRLHYTIYSKTATHAGIMQDATVDHVKN